MYVGRDPSQAKPHPHWVIEIPAPSEYQQHTSRGGSNSEASGSGEPQGEPSTLEQEDAQSREQSQSASQGHRASPMGLRERMDRDITSTEDLREEAPKEHDVRHQLTLKVNTLLLPPPVDFFVGREKALATLRQCFQAHQKRIIAPPITGPGGVGKTQLALRMVQQQVEETPYDHVFWIPAESEEKLLEAYLHIAESLGIDIDKKDLQQAAQTVRFYLKDKHCLYVFDDAPDITAIRDFLPLGQGHVLITSRNSYVGAWPTKPLLMNPFGEQEALALRQAFGYGQSSQEQEAVQSLLKPVIL